MRSQAVVLANALQSLEVIGFVDRDEFLKIQRNNGQLVSIRWTSTSQSTENLPVSDRDLGLIKDGHHTRSSLDGPSDPFLAPPGFLPQNLNFAARFLSPSGSVTQDNIFESSSEF